MYYLYQFRINWRPKTTPIKATSWTVGNFSKVFPFGGCGATLDRGETCELTGVPIWSVFGGTAPIKAVDIAGDYFTFEALKAHFEPTGSFIRFSLMRGSAKAAGTSGEYLWLRTTAWGPAEGIQKQPWKSFANIFSRDTWVVFSRNLATRMPYNL